VTVSELGITITLMTSKASQDQAETIVIPRADMPTKEPQEKHPIPSTQLLPPAVLTEC